MLHILYVTQTINLYHTLPLFICDIKVFKDVSEFSFAGKLIKSKIICLEIKIFNYVN